MRFDGKVLFATGGGSGIAAATARRFVSEGGKAVVLDLDGAKAVAVAAELGADNALGLVLNVADEASVKAAVAATVERFGRIDAVLNAAGHAEFAPLEEWSLDRWDLMMKVHVGGTFLVCREVAGIMRANGGGSIVNIASTAALTANNNNSPYGAAKGAIISFSRQIARDLAPTIRVNTVAPGRTRTGMTEPLLVSRGGTAEEGAQRFAEGTILKRLGTPEELAAPICFLLSDEASFMTGSLVVVDGGETAL
jgi:NAD(P)-dependent dehydrogenase (short-subunit alcohol dehydrogenase family)